MDRKELILKTALKKSGNPITGTVQGSTDQVAKQALEFYEYFYLTELGEFPWSFSTDRRTLYYDEDTGINGRSKRYRFNMPADVLFLWDVYLDEPNFDVGLLTSYFYPQIALPLVDLPAKVQNFAEVVGGKLYADYPEINIFFTLKGDISSENFTVPFIKIMTKALTVALKEYKGSDASVLSYHNKRYETSRARTHVQGSVENQRLKTVEDTPLVSGLRNWRW